MDVSKRSSHGNAYFTGLGNNKQIVFFDNLLDSLDEEEVEAVLAHELGHFKKKHIVKRLISMTLITLLGFAILGWLMQQAWFYTGLGMTTPSTYAALILFSLSSPIFTFFLSPISAMISRKHEFEADEYAAQQADANKLIDALVKLYKDNANTLTPDPLHSAYYDSHPPAPVRITHLTQLTNNNPQ
jgi:STE24 endopeptidase